MVYISTSCLKGENSIFEPDIIKVINTYIKLGITNMELGAAHNRFNNFPLLRRIKKDNDLDFISHGNFPSNGDKRFLNIASADEKHREKSVNHFLFSIEKLNYLEVDFLSMHPGDSNDLIVGALKRTNQSDPGSALKRAIESLQIIVDKAKDCGIRVAVENMSAIHTQGIIMTPEDFKDIKKDIDVGLLLDIGHLDTYIYHNNTDRRKMIKGFEPYIEEMHCHKGIKADEHLLPENKIFNDFSKSTLKKAKLTLESNSCDTKMILKGKQILEEAKNS